MSAQQDLEKAVARLFPIDQDTQLLASWDVPFSDVSRIAAEGLPRITMEFPMEGATYVGAWGSMYLAGVRYAGDQSVKAVIVPMVNRAGYQVLLLKRTPA